MWQRGQCMAIPIQQSCSRLYIHTNKNYSFQEHLQFHMAWRKCANFESDWLEAHNGQNNFELTAHCTIKWILTLYILVCVRFDNDLVTLIQDVSEIKEAVSLNKKAVLLVPMSNAVILFVLSLSSWYKQKSACLKLVKKTVKSYWIPRETCCLLFMVVWYISSTYTVSQISRQLSSQPPP